MPMSTVTASKTDRGLQNWRISSSPDVLAHIHDANVNIAIYERAITELAPEIDRLLDQQVHVTLEGGKATIITELCRVLNQDEYPLIIRDINEQLERFSEISSTPDHRLLLATINSNMCRRFHTDLNVVRLLCTYSGPGTLWLTDENIDEQALNAHGTDRPIAIDEQDIRQAKTGAVVLLKGALYPAEHTQAVVHRSPTIEESGERRLLLRLDTTKMTNLWT